MTTQTANEEKAPTWYEDVLTIVGGCVLMFIVLCPIIGYWASLINNKDGYTINKSSYEKLLLFGCVQEMHHRGYGIPSDQADAVKDICHD